MYRVFFISPVLAALAFTIPEAYQLMHRPDTIYIPVVFEGLLFAVGYVVFGIFNAIVIVPLCVGLASFTSSRGVGLLLSIVIAAFGTYVTFAAEVFGHEPMIMHRAYFFGAFLPLFLVSVASYHFLLKHRNATTQEPTAGT